MKCRHCNSLLNVRLIDLGSAPASNAYLTQEALSKPEKWYPLRVLVCTNCWLAQTEDYAEADELFSPEYAYFSSFSTTWLDHSEKYVNAMIDRFSLNEKSLVVEIAANDGYLLQFALKKGVPSLGIEPTASTAAAAREKGIEIIEEFFGITLADHLKSLGRSADLMVANNVLAHVPDINDFVKGFSILLKSQGVATFEFPHLLRLIKENQFDTIYHEHYSYLSLTAVERIFAKNGLKVFDVEAIPTHGGSLRVFAQRSDTGKHEVSPKIQELLTREEGAKMKTPGFYGDCQSRFEKSKNEFLSFLLDIRRKGQSVAAYGAAAKGNTFLNFAGIRPDLLPFVVDRNPAKQGKFMPGSRIPIVTEDILRAARPLWVVILPWNLRDEVMTQLSYIRDWGGRFVTAIPELWVEEKISS
ncbi:MAG: class I SAM-dependent methyltransferase [Candidatus Ozemobacteraceae bacterium]